MNPTQLTKQLYIKHNETIQYLPSTLSLDDINEQYHEGELWLERSVSSCGMTYDHTYTKVLVGNLEEKITWDDYYKAYDKII